MRTPPLRRCAGIVLALAAAASPLRAEGARIVEAPGLPPFINLQEAVDAANDGDTILVAEGSYDGFTIAGKSLNVVAAPQQQVSIQGSVRVIDIGLDQCVLLSGVKVLGVKTYPVPEPCLIVSNSLGHVRVDNCEFIGGSGWYPVWWGGPYGAGGDAISVNLGTRMALSHCTIRGGIGAGNAESEWYPGGEGGKGLRLATSYVSVDRCSIQGGDGGDGVHGGRGGDGCSAQSSWLFSAGNAFHGGNGGDVYCLFSPNHGGDGGAGLYVSAGSQAELLNDTFLGGAGGIGKFCSTGNGQPGLGLAGPGLANLHAGTARELWTSRVVFDESTWTVWVTADPGDQVWLQIATRPSFFLEPSIPGVQLAHNAQAPPLFGGVVPSSGQLQIQFAPPNLTTDIGRVFYLQGVGRDLPGNAWLGSPMHVLLLDVEPPPDCNGNQQSDLFDVLAGFSFDCGRNLVPDECDPDCDGNGVSDDCDIVYGTHQDCNENGIPDVCDLAQGTSRDCNANGVPDECDLHSGERSDLNGNGILDECEPRTTWWVDPAAAGSGNGSAMAPFQTIARAMSAAVSGDEIILRDGIYEGSGNRDIAFDGRTLVVRSENGPANCVLELRDLGRAFSVGYAVGEAARIEGLTFRDGRDGTDGGGAIRILGSSLTIQDCIFESCQTFGKGGAIRLDNSGTQILDCVFRGNSTELLADYSQGGAIYFRGDSNTLAWPPNAKHPLPARILRCQFEGNESVQGGAIQTDESLPLSISHCTFFGNVARDSGGAIANSGWTYWGGGGKVDDCLFVGNRSAVRGGAIWVSAIGEFSWLVSVQALVTGSTFVANLAGAEGGALSAEGESSTRLQNCIVWDNTAALGSQLAMIQKTYSGPPALYVDRCDVQGGEASVYNLGGNLTWGTGDLDIDPQFADPDGPDNDPLTFFDNDYRPIAGSPVNDAGDNAFVPSDLNDVDGDGNTREPTPLDLDLARRFVEDLLAPNVGAGTPPLVDMGCYEHP